MIRAGFFDIDGTLLSHRLGAVPEETAAAVLRLKDRGVGVFAATGRHMLELARLPLGHIPFDGYVTLNGQLCLDGAGRVLWGTPFSPEAARALEEAFRAQTLPLMLVEEGRLYLNTADDAVREAQRTISTPVPELGAYGGAPLYSAVAFADRARVEALAAKLPGCAVTSWHARAFDLIPAGGGKAEGIRHMLERLGLVPEDIAAFGDGENDGDMLRYAGVGVAMGSAPAGVKALADLVTEDVEGNGAARGLERLGLL